MEGEIASLYVSIGADFSSLADALTQTRAQLEDLQAGGGLLGALPMQVPLAVEGMMLGVQTALAPLPSMLQAGLKKPIDDVMAAIRAHLAQQVAQLIAQLADAARQIHAAATMFGVPSPVNVAAIEGRASGGAVVGGQAYLVGEAGPEIFVPGASGSIIPNHALGNGGGLNIRGGTFNIYGVQDVESLYDELQRVARYRGA